MNQAMEGKVVGDYRIGELLGKGNYGEVYSIFKSGGSEKLAVKVYSKSGLDMMENKDKIKSLIQNEVDSLKGIRHPNILRIHQYMESANSMYLIFQYCDGGDLSEYLIKQGNPLSESEVKRIAIEMVSGFLELERRVIMHRDVKLENIMKHQNRYVLCDFGFSKLNAKTTNTKLGTPVTKAPEIMEGGNPYSNKCDVWSLGVTLYELLFGEDPWKMFRYTVKTDHPSR